MLVGDGSGRGVGEVWRGREESKCRGSQRTRSKRSRRKRTRQEDGEEKEEEEELDGI